MVRLARVAPDLLLDRLLSRNLRPHHTPDGGSARVHQSRGRPGAAMTARFPNPAGRSTRAAGGGRTQPVASPGTRPTGPRRRRSAGTVNQPVEPGVFLELFLDSVPYSPATHSRGLSGDVIVGRRRRPAGEPEAEAG